MGRRQPQLTTTIRDDIGRALDDVNLAEFSRLIRAYPDSLVPHETEPWAGNWLHEAANDGLLSFVKLMAELGVDVNVPIHRGPEGPILRAAENGHVEVVRYLLDRGARLNHTVEGVTRCFALSGAATAGHLDVVKLLVERGADVNASWAGMNPLLFAISYGHPEVAAYLRQHGAKEPWELVPTNLPGGHAAILAHVGAHRGRPGPPLALPGERAPVAVHVAARSKKWERQTAFTVGLSDAPLATPSGGSYFAELVLYLPADWPTAGRALADPLSAWPLAWLRRAAGELRAAGKWPTGPAPVIAPDPPAPLGPDTKLSALLLLLDHSPFGQVQLPDHRLVNLHTLQPIYPEERAFVDAHGSTELVQRFQDLGIDQALDTARPNVTMSKRTRRRN